MREAARFLETLTDILDMVVKDGMDSERLPLLLEAARKDVETVRLADPSAEYEIGEGDVFWRGRPLAGTIEWAWRQRLLDGGVERMDPPDDSAAFRDWVAMIRRHLVQPLDPRPVVQTTAPTTDTPAVPTKAGPAPPAPGAAPTAPPPDTFSLDEEAERIMWLHGEAANRGLVPRRESEDLIDRLLQVLRKGPATAAGRSLEKFDELTTVHVLNVALLAMGLGRHLTFDEDEIRALGLAGLYHDVGRVRLGDDKHGADPTSPARRALMSEHPVVGARVLMDSGSWFVVAAVVAYEHHLSWRGNGGYPALHFARAPHRFSRIVSVCDMYDVLRTERSYRPAFTHESAVEYLRSIAGKTLDPEIVTGFISFVTDPVTSVVHPVSRPEGGLVALGQLPDSGFDPDFEPRPVST